MRARAAAAADGDAGPVVEEAIGAAFVPLIEAAVAEYVAKWQVGLARGAGAGVPAARGHRVRVHSARLRVSVRVCLHCAKWADGV